MKINLSKILFLSLFSLILFNVGTNFENAYALLPPNAPTSLTATSISTSKINISWTASTLPAGITATGGAIVNQSNNRIHTFTTSGTYQVTAGSGNHESFANKRLNQKNDKHVHRLIPYWGGHYCPECKTGKYAKMEPDKKYNEEMSKKLDSLKGKKNVSESDLKKALEGQISMDSHEPGYFDRLEGSDREQFEHYQKAWKSTSLKDRENAIAVMVKEEGIDDPEGEVEKRYIHLLAKRDFDKIPDSIRFGFYEYFDKHVKPHLL